MLRVRRDDAAARRDETLLRRSVAVAAHVFVAFELKRSDRSRRCVPLVSGVVYCYHTPTDGMVNVRASYVTATRGKTRKRVATPAKRHLCEVKKQNKDVANFSYLIPHNVNTRML
ncbi:hypothetical protein F2P81_008048 [Scophthalmus maximus]|uniref:Uncharacterized protein n=1 Tax=Scophthalmus maximus TaxID=52904 RepID=A0A6A4T166_SCOMX|nr:hypothetical protein F2P81_008048 [Scophthalmus maximus]